MKYMLDTNICIYAVKKNPQSVIEQFIKHSNDDFYISAMTYSELMFGAEKSLMPNRNKVAISTLLSNITILDFDSRAGNEYGKIRAYLEKEGQPIGTMDMLIAAHAISSNCVLVTNNEKEFIRVKNLVVENWAK